MLLSVAALVTLIALILRVYYTATASVDPAVRGDAIQYYSYAWNMLHHHVFSMANPGDAVPQPDGYRSPGYPFLLAIWIASFEDFHGWYVGVLATQVVLGSLVAGMTVLLAAHWLPRQWSACAGIAVAIWPSCVTASGYLISETLYGFLLTLAMLLLARSFATSSRRFAALAGLAFGLAALTNSVAFPFALIIAALALVRRDAPGRLLLTFAIMASALPVGWVVRDTLVASGSVSTTSEGRALQNFVQGAWPEYHTWWRESVGLEPETTAPLPVETRESRMAAARQNLTAMTREQQALQTAPLQGLAMMAERLSAAPARYASWYLFEKPMLLWGWNIRIGAGGVYVYPTAHSPFEANPLLSLLVALCHGLNPLLGLLALGTAACVAFGRSAMFVHNPIGTGSAAMLCATTCLYFCATLVHMLLQAEPRYAIPYRPIEFVLALTAVAAIAGAVRNWDDKRVKTGAGEPQQ